MRINEYMNRIKKLPLGKPNLLKKEDTYTVDISSLKYLEEQPTIDVEGDAFQQHFIKILKDVVDNIKIHDSWVNITTYEEDVDNEFEWHNEKDKKSGFLRGDFAAVLWFAGEEDKGGDLDVLEETGDLTHIKFQRGKLINFPIATYHKVSVYRGKIPRMSLNFTFDYATQAM